MNYADVLVADPNNSNNITLNLNGKSLKGDTMLSHPTTVNKQNKFKIISDCDEVLVCIAEKWLDKIKNHPVLNKYVTQEHLDEIEQVKHVFARSEYSITEWLNIPSGSADLKLALDLYFEDSTFYDDLEPLPFALSLKENIHIAESVVILTHCGYTTKHPCNISKAKWLKKLFADLPISENQKITYVFLTNNITKAEYIMSNNLKFNTIVDDSPSVIYDLIEKIKFDNYEIMFPLYGYNGLMENSKLESEYKYSIIPFHNIPTVTQEEYLSIKQAMLAEE